MGDDPTRSEQDAAGTGHAAEATRGADRARPRPGHVIMGPPTRGAALPTFDFVTTFEVAAPPPAVFDLVVEPEPWLAAWGDLVEMDRVRHTGADGGGGALEGSVRAPLGYRIGGRLEVVEARRPSHVQMRVTGTIRGTGTWTLRPTDAGTAVRFAWTVRPVAAWLRVLTPVARPVLEAGHDAVVRHAVDAAAHHLGADVLAFRSESGPAAVGGT